MAVAIGTGVLSAPRAAAQSAALAQKAFASPEEAVQALRAAVKVHDKAALQDIFGPEVHELLTGDERQDKANSQKFAEAMEEGAKSVSEGDAKVILEIGDNKWPFPIPLVKENSMWRFDTAAGKEEIINRHIGKDELHAIGVCKTYVQAQKQYAGAARDSSQAGKYALRFKSSPGKMDGLYWKTGPSQVTSPFGARVAEVGVDGAHGPAPKPFHGYFFRILTRQGAVAAGGEMDYLKDGSLTGGFALAAYPERWGRSGIMTFIVNQEGKIYQRDLGAKTSQVAAAMAEYNPDGDWTPVKDQGVIEK
jgi:hypothetical protein